ncbi:hypothetical protein AV530_019373 [Patagioenas fasciata monilis]|uniref:Uncharacterized protein n=1 Tax=Patagioenas fasciata monilis TaxID=372326 RepID=A0A1V4JEG1_PATFA|nr:hypothetical protein AV530_019373 [Patagioenas fasciata monilis]
MDQGTELMECAAGLRTVGLLISQQISQKWLTRKETDNRIFCYLLYAARMRALEDEMGGPKRIDQNQDFYNSKKTPQNLSSLKSDLCGVYKNVGRSY